MLQLDFANKWIGGGVLGRGLVQEEILFLIKPECIAARLFTPMLRDDQALFIIGAQRYSAHEGYRDSFRCTGGYHDTTPMDALGRRQTEIMAIDAVDFSSHPSSQYSPKKILREVNKALAGFTHPGSTVSSLPLDSEIATGNWGTISVYFFLWIWMLTDIIKDVEPSLGTWN
jgi:poly(ADP-ribose) glycohydrolase